MSCTELNFTSLSASQLSSAAEIITTYLPDYFTARFQKHLLRAATEYLEASWAWREHDFLFTLATGVRKLDFNAVVQWPADAQISIIEVLKLFEVFSDGTEQLIHPNTSAGGPYREFGWKKTGPASIMFNTALTENRDFRAVVVLVPTSLKIDSIPANVFLAHRNSIFNLAYSYALNEEGREYFNPVQSNVFRSSAMKAATAARLDYLTSGGEDDSPDEDGIQTYRSFNYMSGGY